MRNPFMGAILATISLFVFSSIALGQGAAPPKANPAPFDPHDLSGVWGGGNDLWDAKADLPMLPAALAKFKSEKTVFLDPPIDGPENTDPLFHCEPGSVPRDYFVGHPIEFIMTPTKIIQLLEVYRNWREFFMDGRKMPSHPEGTWFGDSIGHWEGNTLVVETTNFNDRTWLDKVGHPHSDKMKMTERFTRIDHDHLKLDMMIDDPGAYSKPWGGSKTLVLRPGWELEDYLCSPKDEGYMSEKVRDPADTSKKK